MRFPSCGFVLDAFTHLLPALFHLEGTLPGSKPWYPPLPHNPSRSESFLALPAIISLWKEALFGVVNIFPFERLSPVPGQLLGLALSFWS